MKSSATSQFARTNSAGPVGRGPTSARFGGFSGEGNLEKHGGQWEPSQIHYHGGRVRQLLQEVQEGDQVRLHAKTEK
eukprot:CAMPEP_0185583088 /NCGR_PEP_ID=MMETSP0434-20130131/21311_1 /TAXON_ID=626734 ORGANISM="Favella taraikaensis, Strain Fe Narragansett Bay" /NCGR_SAMPLE_ID=MMETSP0434 /ASSEMBLY_ACC=CAM_ASM_000379 /LENGTH=76 /DNA_ID=CAMNT_0028202083 /DNA_START=590 /DNA_END=821 /DNA_ORIENTATION=-